MYPRIISFVTLSAAMVNFGAHQFNGKDGKRSSTAVPASLT